MKIVHRLRSSVARRLFLVAVVASVTVTLVIRQRALSARASEESALQFVAMNGYVTEGYTLDPLKELYAPFLRSTTPQRTASFPVDRMTDDMALQLANIRHLHSIVLYPPDPGWNGPDSSATTLKQCKSLRELDLPLSERGFAVIDQRCPDLLIHVASRPEVKPRPPSARAD